MNIKKQVYIFFICTILPFYSIAQFKIKGKISNTEDQSPIPFATIQTDDHKTISNENGEFEITVDALPVSIKISHTSFQGVQIEKKDDSQLVIILKPVLLTLKEVVVGNYALTLMKNAGNKAKETYKESNYAKAFLRQIAYESGKPTYLNEIYFNADWRNYGLIKWKPTQTRHLKDKGMITYTNLGFFSLALCGYLFNDVHIKPLINKLDSLYTFKLKGTYQLGDEEIAIISCVAKTKINKMYFEGNYFINTATANVLKIEGIINNMKMTSSGPFNIKNVGVNIMAEYKINNEGKNVLDLSTFNFKNKLTVLGVKAKESYFYSTLYMIDYKPIYNENLTDINSKTNDITTTKEMAYDSNFWNENQTIKRTEKESEAIKILESVKKAKH
jgi:hypothetical protein